MKTNLKRVIRIFKLFEVIFFETVFEGFKIVTTFECVRGLVPKVWANIRQSILTVISLSKWTF